MNEQLSRSEQIELLEMRLEISKLKGVANQLRHENQMLKRQGLVQSMVAVMNQPLIDLKRDIMAQQISASQNVAPKPFSDTAIDRAFEKIEAKTVNSPSIPKLALKLTFRIVLVIAVAVTVLAVVS